VTGGKLTIQDGVFRNNISADNAPTVTLTGGELELTPPISAMSWQTNMLLDGTDFDPKPGAVMLTNVGSYPNRPANFSLNAGSVWDLNIASNTLLGGADWVDVPNSCNLFTACDVTPGATFAPTTLNGGSINIIPIGGYTPAVNDTVTILRNALGGVIPGTVTVSDPSWVLQTNMTNTEVQLRYAGASDADYNNNGVVDAADYPAWRKIPSLFGGDPAGYTNWKQNFAEPSPGSGNGGTVPEPGAMVLVGLFASVSLASRRAREVATV
jgi:hypothetical protein